MALGCLLQVLIIGFLSSHSVTFGSHGNFHPLNVLLVSAPTAGHMIPLASLGQELVARGHTVKLCSTTVRGSDFTRETSEKHRLEFLNAGMDPRNRSEYSALTESLRGSSVYWSLLMAQLVLADTENVILHFLDTPDFTSWDVAVFDYVLEGSGVFLSSKWGVPVIINSPGLAFSPMFQPSWPFPSVSSGWGDNLSFSQRLYQSVVWPVECTLKLTLILYSKWLNGRQSSPLCVSLFSRTGRTHPLLMNTVMGVDYPRPHTPLTHYVGPLILEGVANEEQLSSDIKSWLDTRTEGVVFVSMGSLVRLTPHMVHTLTEALAHTHYSALWSVGLSDETLFKNVNVSMVMVVKWAPQRHVLKHPNIKVAILHGGINGLQEALIHAVPVICLPQIFDQPANAQRITHNSLGICLDPITMTTIQLVDSIQAVTTGRVYREAVGRVSAVLRQAGGVKTAANIVEHFQRVGTNQRGDNELCYLVFSSFVCLLVLPVGVVTASLYLCVKVA